MCYQADASHGPYRREPIPIRLWARIWFGIQAAAGTLWWVAVFISIDVSAATLGAIEPVWLVVPDATLFVIASAVTAASAKRWSAALTTIWTTAVTVVLIVYGLVDRAAGWGVLAMVAASTGSILATSVIWWGRVRTDWFFIGPFRFRPASPASAGSHLLRSLSQVVVFWTAFFVVVPVITAWVEHRLRLSLSTLNAPGWAWSGVAMFTVGGSIGLWACFAMSVRGEGTPLPAATARRLVITGPYRWVRNPMAVGGAAQTIGVGLIVGSWSVTVLAIAGGLAWHTLIRPGEEADLAARFGAPYLTYQHRVPYWFPHPKH